MYVLMTWKSLEERCNPFGFVLEFCGTPQIPGPGLVGKAWWPLPLITVFPIKIAIWVVISYTH